MLHHDPSVQSVMIIVQILVPTYRNVYLCTLDQRRFYYNLCWAMSLWAAVHCLVVHCKQYRWDARSAMLSVCKLTGPYQCGECSCETVIYFLHGEWNVGDARTRRHVFVSHMSYVWPHETIGPNFEYIQVFVLREQLTSPVLRAYKAMQLRWSYQVRCC